MVCPNCNVTPLRVKNDNYYCPSCEIYIGSAKNPVEENNASSATTPRWQLQSQTQEDKSEDLITEEVEDKGDSFSIQKLLALLTVTALIVGVYYVIPNLSNYISFSPYCNIKIKEKEAGFKTIVIKELEGIKGRDPFEYINICNYVSTIAEGTCPISDEGVSGINLSFEDHCYFRGSKIIYFNDIKYLEETAKLSKSFWDQQ